MATQDQIRALLESHASKDDKRFSSVALQLAAQAARSGHSRFSAEIKQYVDQLRSDQKNTIRQREIEGSAPSISNEQEVISNLVSISFPKARLADLVLSTTARDEIKRLLIEQRQRDALSLNGFHPIGRVLLIGPPGTGKTSTARVVAGELNLPLYNIRLETVISKYMGETAAKLRMIFDSATTNRGVYFFDEVDALAVSRSDGNDVGEMRRVLSSFLQFLEEDATESIIIAATNNPAMLDDAIFRRFESIIEYRLPENEEIEKLIRNCLAHVQLSRISWRRIFENAAGLSPSEICSAAEEAAKSSYLDGRFRVNTTDLLAAFKRRRDIAQKYRGNKGDTSAN